MYLDACSQGLVERAANVKVKKAEVIWAFIDVDAVPFNRGFYTVNITYYFRITLEVYLGGTKPTEICGLSTFTKKVILFGSEGTAKSFTSCYTPNDTESPTNCSTNLPCASVEVVEPGDAREEAAEHEDDDGLLVDFHAHRVRELRLLADAVDLVAEAGLSQNDPHRDENHKGDVEGDGHAVF